MNIHTTSPNSGYAVRYTHPNALTTFLLTNVIILPMTGKGTSHTRKPLSEMAGNK